MMLRLVVIATLLQSLAFAGPKKEPKKKAPPAWNKREEVYIKGINAKLAELKDDDPRKLIEQYFTFLHDPSEGNAKDFSERALKLREKTGQPLAGLGFFSVDKALCPSPKGDCSFGIGNITDHHLAPLIRNGDPGAIRVALVRHLVSVPSQAELMSYYAIFRVPKAVERHQKEVLTVLHDIRDALALYNPGKTCYQFKFFDLKFTPEKIHQGLPGKEGDELLAACTPPTPTPTPSPVPTKK